MTDNTEQTTQVVGDKVSLPDVQPAVAEVEDGVYNYSDSYVNELKSLAPKYKYHNTAYLRGALYNDLNFLEEVSNSVLETNVLNSDENRLFYSQNPEKFQNLKTTFKNDILSNISSEINVGETLKESINKRAIQLDIKSPSYLKINDFRKLIKENKKKYEKYGILKDGEIVFDDNDNGNITLANTVYKNEELLKSLYSDRYNKFLDSINKSHNSGSVDIENPREMGESYAVWDKFGEEGLTRYLNFKQKYDTNLTLEEQESSVKEAYSFIKNAKVGDKNVNNVIYDFFGSGKGGDFFQITPIKESIETKVDIPKDINNYSEYFYGDKGLTGLLDDVVDRGVFSTVMEITGLDKVESLMPGDLLGSGGVQKFAIDANGDLIRPKKYYSASVEELKDNIENNTDSYLYRRTVADLYNSAVGEKNDFSIGDLAQVVATNAIDVETLDNGTARYKIDYDNAEPKVRLAIDALRLDTFGYGTMITEDDNYVYFEPDLLERLGSSVRPEQQLDYQSNGLYLEQKEGLINGVSNFIVGAGKGIAKTSYDLMGKYVEKGVLEVARKAGVNTLDYEQNVKPFITNNELINGFDNVAMGTGYVLGTLGTYMYGANKLGGNFTKESLSGLQKIRTAMHGTAIGKFMQGGKLAKAFNKATSIHNANSKFFTALNLEVGFAKLEIMGGDETSMFNILPNSGLKEQYKSSGRLVQAGMDLVAAETLSLFFDNFVGVLKLGKDALKSKNIVGRRLNPFTHQEMYVKSPEFRGDLFTIFKNVFDGDESYKVGAELKAGFIDGTKRSFERSTAENFLMFKEEANELLGSAKDDIRAGLLTSLSKNNIELDETLLSETVDEIYNGTMKEIAGLFRDVVKFSEFPEDRLNDLADMLLVNQNSFKAVKIGEKTQLSLSEALEEQLKRPFSVITETGRNKYMLFENTPNIWAKDLAEQLKVINKELIEKAEGTTKEALKKASESKPKYVEFRDDNGNVKYGKVIGTEEENLIVQYGANKKKFALNEVKEVTERVEELNKVKAEAEVVDKVPKTLNNATKPLDEVAQEVEKTIKVEAEAEKNVAIAQDVVEKANSEMAVKPVSLVDEAIEQAELGDFGVNYKMIEQVVTSSGYKETGVKTVRKIAKLLGNVSDIKKIGKNLKRITKFNAKKVPKKGLDVDVVFKHNDEPYIVIQTLPKDVNPSVFVLDEDTGKLIMNPYVRRISKNVTAKEDGTLRVFKSISIDGEQWFEETTGNKGVYLNIQRPIKGTTISETTGVYRLNGERTTLEEANMLGIDGVYKDFRGKRRYKVMTNDQIIDTTNLKNAEVKTNNKKIEAIEDCVAENLPKSGKVPVSKLAMDSIKFSM